MKYLTMTGFTVRTASDRWTLGYEGENNSRTLQIKTTDDLTGFATVNLLIDTLDCGAMTVTTVGNFKVLSMVLTAGMLGEAGEKTCQLLMMDSEGAVIKKTNQFQMVVGMSNAIEGTVPDSPVIIAITDYIDDAINERVGDEILEGKINDWLEAHPEATTTVQDGSITVAKLHDSLKAFATPEMFGAVGDGVTDDTSAIQSALDMCSVVLFQNLKTYLVKSPLVVTDGHTLDLNGCTVTGQNISNGNHIMHNFKYSDVFLGYNGNGNIIVRNGTIQKGSIDFIHGENILFENISFENCHRDHYIEICACKNFTIRDCTFTGMTSDNSSRKEYVNIDNCLYGNFPWFSSQSETYDGTIVDGVLVDNCKFYRNGTIMQDAVGKHSHYDSENPNDRHAKNIAVRNCLIDGATDMGLYFLGADNVNIINCRTSNTAVPFSFVNCNNVSVEACDFEDINETSTVNNCNNFKISRNRIVAVGNYWFVRLTGTCDVVEYSGNVFINSAGSRPDLTYTTATVTNFIVFGNQLHSLAYPSSDSSVSFSRLDRCKLVAGLNASTATITGYDLTNLTALLIEIGSMGSGTYRELKVKAFSGRGFLVGETYKFPVVASDDSVVVVTVTITSATELTLSSSIGNIRAITAQRLIS